MPDEDPITINHATMLEVVKAAYLKGKEDAMAASVPAEGRITYPESQTEVEALLDRAFAPLRAELEGVTHNLDEPRP